ncbi:MAG: hypothetical protein N7Q72_06510, partial [Spiroplasma sp. Tabriz.8]|nr:hypothetical protein [Spiroplasma sp. Tabriz.8]
PYPIVLCDKRGGIIVVWIQWHMYINHQFYYFFSNILKYIYIYIYINFIFYLLKISYYSLFKKIYKK